MVPVWVLTICTGCCKKLTRSDNLCPFCGCTNAAYLPWRRNT